MKRKLLISIETLMLILLFNFSDSFGQRTTKTIIYDWAAKGIVENKSLPFDEPFNVKIINLDTNIKSLQLLIKEGSKSVCKELVDTSCFVQLRTIDELSFTQSKLQSSTIHENLKPNRDYYIGFQIKEKSRISDEAKETLMARLTDNEELHQDIDSLLSAIPLQKLSLSHFNKILYKYVKRTQGAYEIDTVAIKNEKTGEAQYQISVAKYSIMGIGIKVINAAEKLKDTFNLDDAHVKRLLSMVIQTEDNCCQLKPGFSIDNFISYLKSLENELIKKNPVQAEKIEAEITLISDGFKGEYLSKATSIHDWINTSLASVTVEKTYLLINLGTTNIDQESTDANPYISQSFGYGYSPRTSKGLFYFSYSIFFRPVNLSVPLSYYKGKEWWTTRFCANLGFSLEDMSTNRSGKVEGLGSLFGNKSGFVGVGFRPLPFLKLDANMMMYYMNDPNPLLSQKRFVASPVFGVSFNLNIIKLFAGQPNSLSSLQSYANN
ncbi:hypothetical protein [Pedobacter panaciterrae]|uniref:hypothetical protein n=1 Tax=Pedobacter panaciterrae TaxID=363849 RepID=UPI002592EB9F|nr:hypothetical protein [uncultured Pedobacter sp.]